MPTTHHIRTARKFTHTSMTIWPIGSRRPCPSETSIDASGLTSRRRQLPQQRRQPAGSGDFALGEGGEVRLLEFFPGRCSGLLSRLVQGFKYLRLADAIEVVVSGRREPCGHVEMEHSGELLGMKQPVVVVGKV